MRVHLNTTPKLMINWYAHLGHHTNLCHWRCCLIMSCSSQKPDCDSYRILTCCRYKNRRNRKKKHFYFKNCTGHEAAHLYKCVSHEWTCVSVYLLMVKGWRAGCCLGIQMILGELRLGLPSPELPILLVLPLIPMPWPTWEWFSMFLVFIGNVPLLKHRLVDSEFPPVSISVCYEALRASKLSRETHKQVSSFVRTCLVMEGCGGTWWGPPLWEWCDLVAACLALNFDLTEAYYSPCPLPRSRVHLQKDVGGKTNTVREDSSAKCPKFLLPINTCIEHPIKDVNLPRICNMWENYGRENKHLLCGPYKLAPSCDSWPDDDGEGDESI